MGGNANVNNIVLIFIVIIVIVIISLPLNMETRLAVGYSQNSVLNFTEITGKNQYRSEEHTIITEDGYVITVFRISKGRNCHRQNKQRPILIMHGLLENSDVFLDAGPSAGLAYLLSDACYDVWVGNQRGNNYARKHIKLNPDEDADFWQFSVDEIGFYDVPATINYILQHTGADKLNYIGFSQGCAVFFLMCSERPDYCKEVAVMVALAPAIIFDHTESVPLKTVINFLVIFKRILNFFGVHEVFSKGTLKHEFLGYVCQITGSTWIEKLCGSGAYIDGYTPGSITPETQRLIFSHFLVGTSLNNLVRYGQIFHSSRLQKFDYGEKMNLDRYNSIQPPEYNLNAVSTPVVIIQGRSDKVANFEDNKISSSKLPNILEFVEVSDPNWTHFDMLYNRNIKKVIYPKVIEYLEKYSEE